MDLFGQCPRPIYNEVAKSMVIKKVASQIVEWSNGDITLEDAIEDLDGILDKRGRSDDGYELAKALDDKCGYGADSELVSILDGVSYAEHNALTTLIEEWVKENKIEPALPLHTKVKVLRRSKEYEGEITNIHLNDATYVIRVESEGHAEGCGFVLPYEKCIAITN